MHRFISIILCTITIVHTLSTFQHNRQDIFGPNNMAHYSSLHVYIFSIHSHCFFIKSYQFVASQKWLRCHYSGVFYNLLVNPECFFAASSCLLYFLNLFPLVIPQLFSLLKFLILFPPLSY